MRVIPGQAETLRMLLGHLAKPDDIGTGHLYDVHQYRYAIHHVIDEIADRILSSTASPPCGARFFNLRST